MTLHQWPPSRSEWATHRDLIRVLGEEVGGWELDPCAEAWSSAAPRWWGRYDDGLTRPWRARTVWVNPPWSRSEGLAIDPWLLTAHESTLHGLARLVAVHVPCSPDTAWWMRWIAAYADEVRLLSGRVCHDRVDGGSGSPAFASAVAIYRSGPRRPQRMWTWAWRDGS